MLREPLNLLLWQIHLICCDRQTFRISRSLVPSSDLKYAVSVYPESHVDSFLARWRWPNVGYAELRDSVVLLGSLTLTLKHLDPNPSLVVVLCVVLLGLVDGNGRITRDYRTHQLHSLFIDLDAERKGSDIEEKNVLDLLRLLAR